ncbi:4035_t:CDS:2 [Entrophospora sp. SA101]|nr:4035_t:CDS:2 [Entrophospora sp. SA101]
MIKLAFGIKETLKIYDLIKETTKNIQRSNYKHISQYQKDYLDKTKLLSEKI